MILGRTGWRRDEPFCVMTQFAQLVQPGAWIGLFRCSNAVPDEACVSECWCFRVRDLWYDIQEGTTSRIETYTASNTHMRSSDRALRFFRIRSVHSEDISSYALLDCVKQRLDTCLNAH